MRAPIVALLLVVSATLGCRGTSVATQNLDATLSATNQFRYQGAITSLWRDALDLGFGSITDAAGVEQSPDKIVVIKNPTKLALKNLKNLTESTQGRSQWRQNEQVRTLARWARYSPSQLCRERALLDLAPHGERLTVIDPFFPDEAANAAELIAALSGLVDAMREIVVKKSDLTETAQADFDAAIDVLASTSIDIEGGSRLLRALGPFMKGNALPRELRDRIDELSVDVQETMIREAIWAGARDGSQFVRAAALQVGIQVYGEPYRAEALLALGPRGDLPPAVVEKYTRFDIPTVPPAMSRVHVAVSDSYKEAGLPMDARRQTESGIELRGTLVFTLLRIASSELTFTDEARHAAMRALSTVSDGELKTLRPEEWDDWWRTVAPRLETELEALRRGFGRPPSGVKS